MFWSDTVQEKRFVVPENVVDIVFKIECSKIHIDHAWALSSAVHQALPWLSEVDQTGIHLIHGAESGNGWQRPDDNEFILLSKRARFSVRTPATHKQEVLQLSGTTLDVDGCSITVGRGNVKPLSDSNILFCRHLHSRDGDVEEEVFLAQCLEELQSLGITPSKMMCGKRHEFSTPNEKLISRSLMLADLKVTDSVTIQELGLGKHRNLGLGLFIPHRGIDAVYLPPEE